MKKVILFAFLLLGTVFAQAQDISKNALGLRLGDNDGFGGEISYQRGLSSDTRLEVDLGWRNSNHVDAIKLTGLHQWVWNIEGGFNWYAGVGGSGRCRSSLGAGGHGQNLSGLLRMQARRPEKNHRRGVYGR